MLGRISIRTQVVVLLAISQVVVIATVILMIRPVMEGERQPLPVAIARGGLGPLITLIGIIEELPDTHVEPVIAAAMGHKGQFRFVDTFEPLTELGIPLPARAGILALQASFPDIDPERLAVAAQLRSNWHLLNFVRYEAGYQLADGRWIVFTPTDNSIARSFPPLFLFTVLLLLTLPAAAILIWAGTTLVAPVRQLAKRAETFGSDLHAEPIKPRGPREVRVLAQALNEMYARIVELIETRSVSLAAIGHDLRTPLTRMRLRVEMLDDSATKEALLRDTAIMARMIDSALAYIRDEGGQGVRVAFDLAALVRTVADDLNEQGDCVVVNAPDRFVTRGVPEQFTRAINNLIENALQHGSKATVDLHSDADGVTLSVSDDGPGIPAPERARLLRPFERGDAARGDDGSSGFGLGLAIANDVIVRHGGILTLKDLRPSGLKVAIELPHAQNANRL